jgi:hypothetical protein
MCAKSGPVQASYPATTAGAKSLRAIADGLNALYSNGGTLEKTDQTLRLQSRAWIAPRGLVAPQNFKAAIDKYTEVTLRLENVGKEPL